MINLTLLEAQTLCKSCGLCCSGHLFTWVKLRVAELNPSEALGLNVIRTNPHQRGFTQPCPLWQGTCTIYESPHYPRGCASYKCKLLRELMDENIQLANALAVVQDTLQMICELEPLLPASPNPSFRERLVAYKEHLDGSNRNTHNAVEAEFERKADELLRHYEDRFGVDDFIDFAK